MYLLLPFLAFLADLFFKDPEQLPHPVQGIGWILSRLESWARHQKLLSLRLIGLLSLAIIIFLAWLICLLLVHIPLLGLLFSLYLAYAGLSLGALIDKARQIIHLITMGEIQTARKYLGFLVSRDTDHLSESEIYQTLAETISENFNDGFVAPYFYLLIGGPIALWIYKAVSTMDSMWGYKIDYWQDLGWAGAKTDDLLAYLPSRLSAFFIISSGFILGRPWKTALKSTVREAKKTESPNAGWPMAACAWCLQAPMGGESVYFGEKKIKPKLGPHGQEWSQGKIKDLLRLITLAGWIWALVGQIIFLGLNLVL